MPEPVEGPEVPLAPIAGFWRRTGAFVLDGAILGAACWALALVAYDALVETGGWALVIGLGVGVAYFALLDGPFGPSLGKRLLGVRVVDGQGRPISVARAALRCLVLEVPYFLNGAPLPEWPGLAPVVGAVQLFIVFGMGGALLYLYFFNRTTRQSLHDLATGTFVVEAIAEESAPAVKRLPGLHAILAGAWLLLILAWSVWIGLAGLRGSGQDPGSNAELQAVQRAILEVGGVQRAAVSRTVNLSSPARSAWFQVQAFIDQWPGDLEGYASEIAAAALGAGLDCEGSTNLNVLLSRGFTMGFASAWRHERVEHTCAEWREAPDTEKAP